MNTQKGAVTFMTNIKGAIFDCDGTLLDSMQMWVNVEKEYLIRSGATPRPDLIDSLRKFSSYEVAEYFKYEYGLNKTVEQIIAGRYALIEEYYFQKATLKDAVVPVLEALRKRGVRMCVATATDKYLVEPALRNCGILEYFERIVTCDEEKTTKTRPDIFIRAAAYMGTEISDTIVVEDALHAIKSAKKAGFTVVAVYDLSEEHNQEEAKRNSDYYFMSLDEMLML